MLGRRRGAGGKGSGVKEEMLWRSKGTRGRGALTRNTHALSEEQKDRSDIISPCLSPSPSHLCSTSCRGGVHTSSALRRPSPRRSWKGAGPRQSKGEITNFHFREHGVHRRLRSGQRLYTGHQSWNHSVLQVRETRLLPPPTAIFSTLMGKSARCRTQLGVTSNRRSPRPSLLSLKKFRSFTRLSKCKHGLFAPFALLSRYLVIFISAHAVTVAQSEGAFPIRHFYPVKHSQSCPKRSSVWKQQFVSWNLHRLRRWRPFLFVCFCAAYCVQTTPPLNFDLNSSPSPTHVHFCPLRQLSIGSSWAISL